MKKCCFQDALFLAPQNRAPYIFLVVSVKLRTYNFLNILNITIVGCDCFPILANYLLIDKSYLAGGVTVTTWPWSSSTQG